MQRAVVLVPLLLLMLMVAAVVAVVVAVERVLAVVVLQAKEITGAPGLLLPRAGAVVQARSGQTLQRVPGLPEAQVRQHHLTMCPRPALVAVVVLEAAHPVVAALVVAVLVLQAVRLMLERQIQAAVAVVNMTQASAALAVPAS